MFRTVFPSIIRSLRLYIQHRVCVIQVLWLLASGNEMEREFHLAPVPIGFTIETYYDARPYKCKKSSAHIHTHNFLKPT
jgi:hypothetical protein